MEIAHGGAACGNDCRHGVAAQLVTQDPGQLGVPVWNVAHALAVGQLVYDLRQTELTLVDEACLFLAVFGLRDALTAREIDKILAWDLGFKCKGKSLPSKSIS